MMLSGPWSGAIVEVETDDWVKLSGYLGDYRFNVVRISITYCVGKQFYCSLAMVKAIPLLLTQKVGWKSMVKSLLGISI